MLNLWFKFTLFVFLSKQLNIGKKKQHFDLFLFKTVKFRMRWKLFSLWNKSRKGKAVLMLQQTSFKLSVSQGKVFVSTCFFFLYTVHSFVFQQHKNFRGARGSTAFFCFVVFCFDCSRRRLFFFWLFCFLRYFAFSCVHTKFLAFLLQVHLAGW